MCAFPKQRDTVDIVVINLWATCLNIFGQSLEKKNVKIEAFDTEI